MPMMFMMIWFALFVNLVCLACVMLAHIHGTCALNKYGTSKYPSGLAFMQADSNLGKTTATHFGVQNTQDANENCQT